MKKVLFFNHIPLAGKRPDLDWKKQLEYAGNNTGNMLFVESMKEQVNYSLELWFAESNCYDSLIDRAVGVLPMANLIGIHDRCAEVWSELISKVPFPIVPVGLGAQSSGELNTPQKVVDALPKSKIYAFKSMAERVKSMGVRGDFTAQCLEYMGIKNYKIIGCPSAYKYLNGKYDEVKAPVCDNVVCNITTGNVYESKILRMAMEYDWEWIMQMETEKKGVFQGLDKSHQDIIDYTQKRGNMFFNIADWYKFLKEKQFTFSFGSRFHGNMIALRAGIPALWVVHDSRTRELADTFSLPAINYKQLEKIHNAEELLEYCDYSAFYRKYQQKCKEYVAFLEENEIAHKFTLTASS